MSEIKPTVKYSERCGSPHAGSSTCVGCDPDYAKKYPNAYNNSPIKLGEQVLYLGEVPNAIGHCAVAKHSGEVVWLVHPQDFRKATEDEL